MNLAIETPVNDSSDRRTNMNTNPNLALKSLIAAAVLATFSSPLLADGSFSTLLSHEVTLNRGSIASIDQDDKRVSIQRSIVEIIEKGCGPMGTLEGFQQAQYERGERKYPPIRLHVLAIAKKLESADDDTFNRLGSEVLRNRDDFRSGRILTTDLGAALQTIFEQL
jgi:hypothetical protein